MRPFLSLAVVVALLAVTPESWALELTQRKLTVAGKLNVAAATKVADKLIAFDAQAEAAIFMFVTATKGSAQGVMIVADTIRSLRSPVVAVVATQVHGAGTALVPFADKVFIYPSAGLVFTEVEYEGVKKPEPQSQEAPKPAAKPAAKPEAKGAPPTPKKKQKPTAEERFLQQARQSFLDRFYSRLAQRISWRDLAFKVKLAEGGFVLTPEEALRQKIVDTVVDRISFTQLPEVKREVKIVTTEKTSKTAPKKD